MVKAVKGNPIKGYFHSVVGGKWRKYAQSNITEFVDRVPPALARHILRHHDASATIVPIPNSHVTSVTTENFNTLEFARKIAACSGGKLEVTPALVFRDVQRKSREGGPREPSHFETAYQVLQQLDGPIILFDDVCTGGGHLIGAHWRPHGEVSPVVLACTFGRSTKRQLANPVGLLAENLDVSRP
jgi:hypothetical protein